MSIRHPSRAALALAAVLAAGCGGSSEDDTRSVDEVRGCLEEAGLDVLGEVNKPAPGDTNAPDRGEVVLRNGTFVAIYSSESRADRAAGALRAGVERLGGTITRHGPITVLYTRPPNVPGATGKPDPRVEGCV